MHSVTIKISSEFPIEDTSAAGIRQLLRGIGDGQCGWAGSVEVVEGPTEVVEPSEAIRKRLLAVLGVRPKTIVPILSEKVVTMSGMILPDMSNEAIRGVRMHFQDCAEFARQYGRDDIATELECISHTLENDHVG